MKSSHKGNGRGYITETPDVSHIKNVDVTHEMSDVDVKGIAVFVVGLTVMTVVVYVLMLFMFKVLSTREDRQEPPPSPMAMSEKERLPPEPRLQSAPGFGEKLEAESGVKPQPEAKPLPSPKDPLWEIRVLRQQWDDVLMNGVKDPSGKVVVMPIEKAMQELLRQGLPSRITELPEEGPGWHAKDYAVEVPTAASSGRMTEKRK